MAPTASIELLPQTLPRSSHSIAVIGDSLYILGGEIQPREPATPFLHSYNLKDGSIKAHENEAGPSVRVGAASVVVDGKLYLWGGRGGKAMTPLNEEAKFWIYDGQCWSQSSKATGDIPDPRSYHSLAATKDKIYLHAGCPVVGRLATLHVYSIAENKWTQLPSAPSFPRGGTSLVALENHLLRFGGFNGSELGGQVDVYSINDNEWTSRPFTSGPGNRSVANFVPHPVDKSKAVLLFGEKTPSSDGHNSAGKFWNDIWVYDFEEDKWTEVIVEAEAASVLSEGGCGWGGACLGMEGDIYVWGGLNERNERVGSGWRIRLSE